MRGIVAYETGRTDLELLHATDADDADVRSLLAQRGVAAADVASGCLSLASTRFVVRSGRRLVAYMTADPVNDIGCTETRTVTVFDNVFAPPFPIPLDRLQQLGCGRPNDLITTRAWRSSSQTASG